MHQIISPRIKYKNSMCIQGRYKYIFGDTLDPAERNSVQFEDGI